MGWSISPEELKVKYGSSLDILDDSDIELSSLSSYICYIKDSIGIRKGGIIYTYKHKRGRAEDRFIARNSVAVIDELVENYIYVYKDRYIPQLIWSKDSRYTLGTLYIKDLTNGRYDEVLHIVGASRNCCLGLLLFGKSYRDFYFINSHNELIYTRDMDIKSQMFVCPYEIITYELGVFYELLDRVIPLVFNQISDEYSMNANR